MLFLELYLYEQIPHFTHSPHVCMGFVWFLATTQEYASIQFVYASLPLGVNMRISALYAVMDWCPI